MKSKYSSFVFKPRRKKDGKVIEGRLYCGRYRIDGAKKYTTVSLNTPEKSIAKERLGKILYDLQAEGEGMIRPKAQRDAAQKPLLEHLAAFVLELDRVRGNTARHCTNVERRATAVIKECGWQYLRDVNPEAFENWRTKNGQLATKTTNEYLAAVSSLLNWMLRRGLIEHNPLRAVVRATVRGRQSFQRRALTPDELRRLLAVAGVRKVIYLAAVWTGLRRNELHLLRWGDIQMDGANEHTWLIHVRPETTKNGKSAVLPIHPELREALLKYRPENWQPDRFVFPSIPTPETLYRDMMRAGIQRMEGNNRKADFHSLRKTYNMHMQLNGMPPVMAQRLMRHSDIRLTTETYIDDDLLPNGKLLQALPRYIDAQDQRACTQRRAQENGFLRIFESPAVTSVKSAEVKKKPVDVSGNHGLSLPVTNLEMVHPEGLEPTRYYPLDPESSASANSATGA